MLAASLSSSLLSSLDAIDDYCRIFGCSYRVLVLRPPRKRRERGAVLDLAALPYSSSLGAARNSPLVGCQPQGRVLEMGSSLLDPRRKRRRTRAHSAGLRHAGDRRCAISLPWVAALFGLGMAAVVGIRKGLKSSARNMARAARAKEKIAYPLAVLLEQHDIEPQAARFADPLRRCLANPDDDGEPPAERLGLFTCVADTRFFLRAVGEALHFPSVTVVDVGNPPPHLGYETGAGAGMTFARRDSEVVPETGLQQARIKVGDPLPYTADLVLIEAREEEALSPDAWVDLLDSWMRVLSESGLVVIHGPQEEEEKEKAAGEEDDNWHGNTHMWEAISTLACDGGHGGIDATSGDFDGGLTVVRRAGAGENGFDAGCSSHTGHEVEGDNSSGAAGAARAKAPPHPLRFESLFLWATGEQYKYTTTAMAIEAVEAKFGGAEVVRRHARRRRDRSACLAINTGGEAAASAQPLVEEGGGDGHLRAEKWHGGPSRRGAGAMASNDAASQWYLAARACLERHLQEYTRDVRAGFALEMVLRAIGGNGVDRQVARLRARMSEEIGPSGDLLWRVLHARAAGAAATGSLL